ncbi:MAG: methyltransferase [Gammaproteobacteria bacterium]|jgi:demethylspheroidene O-methyltransferase|nr:methyltransferase [Gammaproteobacteria bacterium]
MLWSKFRQWWLAQRDRLLMSPDFQRWAARFPLTGFIARRRARQTFDLVAGFVYTQVLVACVHYRLFEHLAAGPLRAAELARRTGLSAAALATLVRAAVALQLLEQRGEDCFGLGALGAPLLANPGLLALIRHNELLYSDMQDPVALLEGRRGPTELGTYWAYATASDPAQLDSGKVAHYSDLMAASQAAVAAEVIDSYDFSPHSSLLDVGGGDGAFCAAVARVHPTLQFTVADLPAVAARAQQRFDAPEFPSRGRAVGVNFHRDSLPPGADIVTLVRVVHDHDDADVITLFRAVRAALAPGGTLLIAEQLAGTPGAETVGDVYFGFYLLAMGRGRPRTVTEISELLAVSGFAPPRELPTAQPLQVRVLAARPLGG